MTDHDRAQVRERVFYETESTLTGAAFLAHVDSRLALDQFDLLRIDPFLAYLGEDVTDTKATAAFLRNGLNPILARRSCACALNHHTPKVTNRDTSNWRGSDWMYAGAGSADITNWARAAIVIDPTFAPHVFKFHAAKRGGRIGWMNDEGERETMRHFCHASDGLYWRAADEEDLAAVESETAARKTGRPVRTPADLRALVPKSGAIEKKELLERARSSGFTKRAAADTLDRLLEGEELFEWNIPRRGTRAQVRISLHEQTLSEVNP